MKGKAVVMIKRWWLTAVVFTCAMSLTSCSKKKPGELLTGGPGYTQCAGTIGDFDVWLYASQKAPGMYELYVTPVTLEEAGDIVSITVANSQKAYKQMVHQVVLNPQQTIYAGLLSEQEVEAYNIIAITPFDPYNNFAESRPANDAFCEYQLPASLSGQN